jgi:replicative DNA helicase
MSVTARFSMAQDFTDAAAERAVLQAARDQPQLRFQLREELFCCERAAWSQPETLGATEPYSLCFEDARARLEELTLKRQVASLQERLGKSLYSEEPASALLEILQEGLKRLTPAQAQPAPTRWGDILLVEVMTQAQNRLRQRQETGLAYSGVTTGLTQLDLHLNGLCTGLHVLAGAPGAGKTTLCLQIAMQAARSGVPVVYVTYENSPTNVIGKVLCSEAQCSLNQVERGFGDIPRLCEAAERIQDVLAKILVLEGTGQSTVLDVEVAAREGCEKTGSPRCLIIFDYMQRAAHGAGYEQLRHNVSALAAQLRELSNRLDSPVLAISSQNRSAGGYGAGGGSSALDSLKESGDLEYSADTVLFLKRSDRAAQDPARAVDLVIAKNRYGASDLLVPLVFRPDLGILREVAVP